MYWCVMHFTTPSGKVAINSGKIEINEFEEKNIGLKKRETTMTSHLSVLKE